MASHLNGLQALMRQEVCPMGIYVHCWEHRFNLVVVSSIQGIYKASSSFSNMATLHTFFSTSVPHDHFVKVQKELCLHGVVKGQALQQDELQSLSKTRWCCQAEACGSVVTTLGAIIQTIDILQKIPVMQRDAPQRLLTKAAILSNYYRARTWMSS